MTFAYTLPGTPLAVYSLRLLVPAYAGHCLRVARWSDNTTLDVGFTSNGLVDYASALTFADGWPLSVAIWYDQSGNGYDVAQPTVESQPQFLVLGSLPFGGQPWISFSGAGPGGGSVNWLNGVTGTETTLALTGDHTVGFVVQNLNDLGGFVCGTLNGSVGWGYAQNFTAGKFNSYIQGTETVATNTTAYTTTTTSFCATRASGTLSFFNDGVAVGGTSGSTNTSQSTNPFQIGGAGSANQLIGPISEVFIYGSALTSGQVQAIQANEIATIPQTPFLNSYNNVSSVQMGTETIYFGNVLEFEYTQPWTVFAAVECYSTLPDDFDGGIVGNINNGDPNFGGWGLMLSNRANGNGGFGAAHIAIRNAYPTHCIDVFGSQTVTDGNKHFIACTYDGSGVAAGIKFYVDGVLDTSLVAIIDNLDGQTIIDPTYNQFAVGGRVEMEGDPLVLQYTGLGQSLRGTMAFAQVDTIVRDGAYIAAYSTQNNLPPNDATHTQLRVMLTEGSGTTAHDTGAVGNNFNGTLSSATMWRASTTQIALVATEAHDTAAITISDPNKAALAVTEARDTAAFTVHDKNLIALSTTEARDTALFSFVHDFTVLQVTEAKDVASFSALSVVAHFSATEAQDVAAFTGGLIIHAALASTEAKDIASIELYLSCIGRILTTEVSDISAIEVTNGVIVVTVTDTPTESGQLYYAVGQETALTAFYKSPTGGPVIPEIVRLFVQPPSGPVIEYYTFKRPVLGAFTQVVPLTAVGIWTYTWETSGTFITRYTGDIVVHTPTFTGE